jgi:LacI family transcriptional regulator
MAEKIRIKDIAELSGVSVGTVDRILHNRPNVSKAAREKVEKVLKEINYQPNMYAAALAYNKSYNFTLLMPKHASEAYWEEIEEGAKKCVDVRRDFHIQADVKYYKRFDTKSFVKASEDILKDNPNGVIIVPSDLEVTQQFTDQLHQREIPFILLDSYMPDLKPLSFFGQDSFQSGYFAAKMLMLIASKEKEIMLMKQMKNGKVASKQQDNREVGFRHYMHDHFPAVKILDIVGVTLIGEPRIVDNPLGIERYRFVMLCDQIHALALIIACARTISLGIPLAELVTGLGETVKGKVLRCGISE